MMPRTRIEGARTSMIGVARWASAARIWRERPTRDLAHVVRLEAPERHLAHVVGLPEVSALQLHHPPTIDRRWYGHLHDLECDILTHNMAHSRSSPELARTNVTLPATLLREVDRFAGPRGRSRYVAEAV